MSKSNAQRAWERLTLSNEMQCEHSVGHIGSRHVCRKCEYYYERNEYDMTIVCCLKQDIREWTLYRIAEGT